MGEPNTAAPKLVPEQPAYEVFIFSGRLSETFTEMFFACTCVEGKDPADGGAGSVFDHRGEVTVVLFCFSLG